MIHRMARNATDATGKQQKSLCGSVVYSNNYIMHPVSRNACLSETRCHGDIDF